MIKAIGAAAAFAALGFLPVLATAQQSDEDWRADCLERRGRGDLVRFCDVRVTQIAAPAGALRVAPGTNGGVAIEGWTGNRVEIHARIEARAGSDAEARALAETVRVSTTSGISATGPENDRDSNWNINFLVYVPLNSDLDIATENGPLSVRSVSGRMTLETLNGPLALSQIGGNVHARAENGPISIRLEGDSWQGEGLDAETINGPVTLSVPDGYNAQLETGTDNGPFASEIPLTVTVMGRMRGPFNTTLGRGGAPIRVVTTNGPVVINRR